MDLIATESDTYPGTNDTKNAANKPAFDDQHSFVNKYVTIAVNPANIGAVNKIHEYLMEY